MEHDIGLRIPVDTQPRRWFDEEKEGSKSSRLTGGFRSFPLGIPQHMQRAGITQVESGDTLIVLTTQCLMLGVSQATHGTI